MEAEEAAAAIFGSDAGSDGGARPGNAPPPKKKRRRLRYRRMSAATAVARERLIRAEQERTAAGEAVEAAQRRVEEEALALANALRHQQDMRPRVKAAQEAVVDAELREPGRWNEMYHRLADHKEKFGTANVSSSTKKNGRVDGGDGGNSEERKQLAAFCLSNRVNAKFPPADRRSLQAPSKRWKIDALNRLGFVWGVGGSVWDGRLEELRQYKELHGHSRISHLDSEHRDLYSWLVVQKTQHRRMKEGEKSQMTEERAARLEALGVEWSYRAGLWNERLRELKAFRDRHGHTQVTSSIGDPLYPLTQWCRKQKHLYRKIEQGDAAGSTNGADGGPLTAERISQLEEVGFFTDSTVDRWAKRLRELEKYKEMYGHTYVPLNSRKKRQVGEVKGNGDEDNEEGKAGDTENGNASGHDALGGWVKTQRDNYRKYKAGEACALTADRVEMLENLGFDWCARGVKPNWMAKYDQLRKFGEVHGRLDVPKDTESNLLRWIRQQRLERRQHDEGKVPRVYEPEKVRLLDAIGFDWRDSNAAASDACDS
jgi:hypothetical protein